MQDLILLSVLAPLIRNQILDRQIQHRLTCSGCGHLAGRHHAISLQLSLVHLPVGDTTAIMTRISYSNATRQLANVLERLHVILLCPYSRS